MTVVLELRGVSRAHRSGEVEVAALRGLDLTIEGGSFVAVMGPSGSGKSTLLHLMGGLDRPSEGEVLLDGTALSDLSRRELARVRARRVGFVFQTFNLVPTLTVGENVALPAVLARRRPASYAARVAGLLADVGLADLADRFPGSLSGGEQQRAALARALVMEPGVLLADEPTGSLDSHTGAEVLGLIERRHAAGQTVVLVTHDHKVASRAERVVYLRDGSVVDDIAVTARDRASRPLTTLLEVGERPVR